MNINFNLLECGTKLYSAMKGRIEVYEVIKVDVDWCIESKSTPIVSIKYVLSHKGDLPVVIDNSEINTSYFVHKNDLIKYLINQLN